jgi:hypothetical protein
MEGNYNAASPYCGEYRYHGFRIAQGIKVKKICNGKYYPDQGNGISPFENVVFIPRRVSEYKKHRYKDKHHIKSEISLNCHPVKVADEEFIIKAAH